MQKGCARSLRQAPWQTEICNCVRPAPGFVLQPKLKSLEALEERLSLEHIGARGLLR
jgi:hypothetical protein